MLSIIFFVISGLVLIRWFLVMLIDIHKYATRRQPNVRLDVLPLILAIILFVVGSSLS